MRMSDEIETGEPASPLPGRLRVHAVDCHDELKADLLSAAEDLEEYEISFNMRWNADMRAIKRWQAANPGNDLVWPDHADLVVWLLGELERIGSNVE